MVPRLLLASPDGRVFDHPTLQALARSGDDIVEPTHRPMGLPRHGKLVSIPGHRPVGFDPTSGRVEVVDSFRASGRRFTPEAVGALLPPGCARTLLPAGQRVRGPTLPQWAYTAAGWSGRGPVVWAVRTDRRTHWDPSRFSTPDLERRIARRLAQSRPSRLLRQLGLCARVYRCFTAQNVFYERDEGAIPASAGCNARCVGCISEQPASGPPASHARVTDPPAPEDMADVAAHHLANATGRVMTSFGQGCEGEPLTRWREIVKAVRIARGRTRRGSLNVNTNASLPHAVEALCEAGVDAFRVSLNSASTDLYAAYFRPTRYGFADVERSLAASRAAGAYVALNLLTFPGVTDRDGEVERLCDLVVRHRVDQVQVRSLCIDPDQYMEVARGHGADGEAVGVPALLDRLRACAPWISIGNFARALSERP